MTASETKECTKCKKLKSKKEFNKDRARKGGLRAACKQCDREYYAANRGKINAKSREYWAANREKLRARRREYYAANREKIIASNREYKAANREKVKAHSAILGRVRNGTIPHPKTLACADCGGQAEHYHHEDYSKPLEVVALCVSCHTIRHRTV